MKTGFTLVELLIVLGIVIVVSILSIPFIQSFQDSSDLQTYADNLNYVLRRAHQQAVNGQNNSSWGVYFNEAGKNFTLFKGDSFATRDQSYDQAFDYPNIFNISTDFGDQIIFSVYSGQASVTGSIIFSGKNNKQRIISISSSNIIQVND